MTLSSRTPEIRDYFLQQKIHKASPKKEWGGRGERERLLPQFPHWGSCWLAESWSSSTAEFFFCCCWMSQGGLVWPWAASAAQQGSRCLQAPLYWICKTKTFKLAEGHLKSLQRFPELIWAALSRISASMRSKIKNKVFDRMLSPLNPSRAEQNALQAFWRDRWLT